MLKIFKLSGDGFTKFLKQVFAIVSLSLPLMCLAAHGVSFLVVVRALLMIVPIFLVLHFSILGTLGFAGKIFEGKPFTWWSGSLEWTTVVTALGVWLLVLCVAFGLSRSTLEALSQWVKL